jgi:hypothetical protein
LVAVLLGATLLSALSMVIASTVRSREQFMGPGQLVTLGPERLAVDVAVLVGGIVVTVAIASRTFPRRVL